MPLPLFLFPESTADEVVGKSQIEDAFFRCPNAGIGLCEDGNEYRVLGIVPYENLPVKYTFNNESDKWHSSNPALPCFNNDEMLERGFPKELLENWWNPDQAFYIFVLYSDLQAAGVEIHNKPGQKWNGETICFQEVKKPSESSSWDKLTQEWNERCSCGSGKFGLEFSSSLFNTSLKNTTSDFELLFDETHGLTFCRCKC